MPRSLRGPLVTSRDLEILAALDRTPLTAAQMLRLSGTFPQPFTTERRVRERLHALCGCGRIRRHQYATAGPGAPNYYLLTRIGYEILHGPGVPPPRKHYFDPIAVARQHHTHSLAAVIVHASVAAHARGLRCADFYRENTLRLAVGDEVLRPDSAFTFRTPEGREFHFVVELDNSTERVRSDKDADSWQRKLRLYETLQDQSPRRFRVLVVTTRSSDRLDHILALAADLARNPARALVYGIHLDRFLAVPDPLHSRCFMDHRRRPVSLILPRPA